MSGLTVTTTVVRAEKGGGISSFAGTNAVEIGTLGLYHYNLVASSVTFEGDYIVLFTTNAAGVVTRTLMDRCTVGRGVAILGSKTLNEFGASAVPPASPLLEQAIMLPYQSIRNKTTTSSSELKLHTDGGAEVAKAVLEDNGSTLTRNQLTTP